MSHELILGRPPLQATHNNKIMIMVIIIRLTLRGTCIWPDYSHTREEKPNIQTCQPIHTPTHAQTSKKQQTDCGQKTKGTSDSATNKENNVDSKTHRTYKSNRQTDNQTTTTLAFNNI